MIIVVILAIITIYMFDKNKQFDNRLTNYKPIMFSEHEYIRNISEYQAIQADFLLDTLTNKNIEEFIFDYSNGEWGDTIDCNFILKIIFDNEKHICSYLKKEYVNFKHPKTLSSSYTLANPSVYGLTKHYFIYFKPVKSGLIKDSTLIQFLSDSIFKYSDRQLSSTGNDKYSLLHLKYINDTLKFKKYDFKFSWDRESKFFKIILKKLKEETSK